MDFPQPGQVAAFGSVGVTEVLTRALSVATHDVNEVAYLEIDLMWRTDRLADFATKYFSIATAQPMNGAFYHRNALSELSRDVFV